jgi:hypothetical protein
MLLHKFSRLVKVVAGRRPNGFMKKKFTNLMAGFHLIKMTLDMNTYIDILVSDYVPEFAMSSLKTCNVN